MPQAPSYEPIYDLETPLEEAVAALLVAAGFSALTRLNSNAEFQQQRPRVTIIARETGPTAQAHFHLVPETHEKHIDMFAMSLSLELVTEPTATGNTQHPLYRTRIRRIMAKFGPAFPDIDLLPYHVVCRCWTGGSDPRFDTENGIEKTTFTYSLDYMIRSDAWPGLRAVDVGTLQTDTGGLVIE